MSKVILNPEYGLYESNGRIYASSRDVAHTFQKQHGHVLRDVERLDCSADFRRSNFGASSYCNTLLNSLSYPITVGEVFGKLCDYVGVPRASLTFINSNRILMKPPLQTENITAREVLRWIAEEAASFAKMSRYGEVMLTWFGDQSASIIEGQYFAIDPSEYQVAPINKLQISASQSDIGVIIGDGDNGYQIMDNPFLYGNSDTEIRQLGVPIYNRLAAYPAFYPLNARAVCDWSIEAGDVVSIELRETVYRLPLYFQTITWNGGAASVVYESTGAERRPVMSAVIRRTFNQNRSMHELTVNVNGLFSKIVDAGDNISELSLTAQGLSLRLSDAEESVASIELATSGLKLAIDNNRLTFDANGLTIYNNQGRTLWQDPATGNLNISGTLHAAGGSFAGDVTAYTGTIGGMEVNNNGFFYNQQQILDRIGNLRLANFYVTGQGVPTIGTTTSSINFYIKDYGTPLVLSTTGTAINDSLTLGAVKYEQAAVYLLGVTSSNKVVKASDDHNTTEGRLRAGGVGIYDGLHGRSFQYETSGTTWAGPVYYINSSSWASGLGGKLIGPVSSIRFKDNVRELEELDNVDKINSLVPVKYEIKNTNQSKLGLIAEDMYDIFPESVNFVNLPSGKKSRMGLIILF